MRSTTSRPPTYSVYGSLKGVSVNPGQTIFTRMPAGANSAASDRVNEITAPLDAAYAQIPAPPL